MEVQFVSDNIKFHRIYGPGGNRMRLNKAHGSDWRDRCPLDGGAIIVAMFLVTVALAVFYDVLKAL